MAEKRYALTQYSAQTLARGGAAAAKSQDRWHRTGGYNPGPPSGLYPRRGGGGGGEGGKVVTTRARAMAGVWGRPAAAPEVPLDPSPAHGMARDRLLPGTRGGAARGGATRGGSLSVRQRSQAYAKAHKHDVFG